MKFSERFYSIYSELEGLADAMEGARMRNMSKFDMTTHEALMKAQHKIESVAATFESLASYWRYKDND